MDVPELRSRIVALERRLVELKARVPAHSASMPMAIELEEVEEGLAALRKELDGKLHLSQS